jgi:hypothetical protein
VAERNVRWARCADGGQSQAYCQQLAHQNDAEGRTFILYVVFLVASLVEVSLSCMLCTRCCTFWCCCAPGPCATTGSPCATRCRSSWAHCWTACGCGWCGTPPTCSHTCVAADGAALTAAAPFLPAPNAAARRVRVGTCSCPDASGWAHAAAACLPQVQCCCPDWNDRAEPPSRRDLGHRQRCD